MNDAARIVALEEQVEDLREQVRYWQDEAQQAGDVRLIGRFREALGLRDSEARVMIALHRSGGQLRTMQSLLQVLPANDHVDERSLNIVSVHLARLRIKVGRDKFKTVYRSGVALTPEGLALCDRVTQP